MRYRDVTKRAEQTTITVVKTSHTHGRGRARRPTCCVWLNYHF